MGGASAERTCSTTNGRSGVAEVENDRRIGAIEAGREDVAPAVALAPAPALQKRGATVRAAPSRRKPASRKTRGEKTQDADRQPLNRVREVREQQGVSLRSFAKRLGLDAKSSRALEDPYRDLLLSELVAIQRALEVPLSDLLFETDELSRPVAERAKMVKVMKTAVAIRETSTHMRLKRMGEMLCEQLREVMPELAEVTGWPQYGARRGKSAVGKALSDPISLADLSRE